ncbi:MAG: hypothetical protein FWH04_09150 [Oscillospiraceae bacterium]|nr:hypothetical protein [Oscillospiraceae bacterium]
MRKETAIFGGTIFLVVLFIFLKHILLWGGVYPGKWSLNIRENKEIKFLLLNLMKDEHSNLFSADENRLYTEEYIQEYRALCETTTARSFFVSVNSNFMKSVEKTAENKYTAVVQLKWPDDWCYDVTITVTNGQYRISYYGIDP